MYFRNLSEFEISITLFVPDFWDPIAQWGLVSWLFSHINPTQFSKEPIMDHLDWGGREGEWRGVELDKEVLCKFNCNFWLVAYKHFLFWLSWCAGRLLPVFSGKLQCKCWAGHFLQTMVWYWHVSSIKFLHWFKIIIIIINK